MNTLINRRLFRATLAAFGLAAALLAVPPDASAQRATRTASAEATETEGVVNIQTASPEQLELLPGVGPAKAQAIIAQRDRRAFRRVEDILRVHGIGRATFRRLRPMLTVDGPTTLAPSERASAPAETE